MYTFKINFYSFINYYSFIFIFYYLFFIKRKFVNPIIYIITPSVLNNGKIKSNSSNNKSPSGSMLV